jgi:arylsulfatase A-like enzyme
VVQAWCTRWNPVAKPAAALLCDEGSVDAVMNAIVLISDSFRRDHLGCYGNPWIHTPHLDRLAEKSAVFEQYYAASYPTVPNRWDLCTGRFGFTQRGWQPLERGDVTWGQILSRNGVHTQMIWDTPMLGAHDYNYTKGFQGMEFVHGQKGDSSITDPRLQLDLKAQPHKIRNAAALAGYLRNHHGRTFEREYCVGRTISTAMDWIETNHTRDPFLLWVDMWDPHEPFDCPSYDYERYADPTYDGDVMHYPEYGRANYMTDAERRHLKALYAGNVTLADRWVGSFLDLADRLGLFRNTLIIWASDHGHLFGDHDLQGKPGGELGRLYEVTARVPLLVRHPDGLGAGQRVSGIVQPPDVLPTVLDAMGVGIPNQVEGRSFLPLMDGSRGDRPYAFSSRFPPAAALPGYRSGDGAAFDGWVGSDRNVEPSTVTGDEWAYLAAPVGMSSELYNLRDDPGQTQNVLDSHRDVADRMREAWIAFLRQHGASDERIRPFLDGSVEVRTPRSATLFAIRDDHGLWIAFEKEQRARRAAYLDGAPGPRRSVEEVTFGAVFDDNPRNLMHAFGQYYWAEDFAS